MRRITCREAAIEGVITRHGTLVGPLMTELAGFPELTPYGGGWCGNDVHGSLFSDDVRAVARARTMQMGERLRKEGYRGYFELDFLADVDTGEMYLGEMNPRVTGASSMTNVTAVAYGDMPLFLFHLLEFMDVDYEIDVDELNERWAHPQNIDAWSQFILKETDEQVEMLTGAPQSGIWRMQTNGTIRFARRDTDWHTIADEDHAFYLRIADAGNYRYPGADLGILVTRGNLMDDDGELTDRAHSWITAIKGEFHGEPATTARDGCPSRSPSPSRCCDDDRDPVRGRPGARAGRALAGAVRPACGRPTGAGSCTRARPPAPTYAESRRMLREHMPELVPTWERLVELAGGGDVAARMLSMWRPPSYLSGCSQGVLVAGDPMLVRNYDYAPQPAGGRDLVDRLGRPPGDRHERLPVGPAGRRQRGRAGDLAGVRRATGGRRRLRRPAGHALRAADLLDGRRGAARRWPGCRTSSRTR